MAELNTFTYMVLSLLLLSVFTFKWTWLAEGIDSGKKLPYLTGVLLLLIWVSSVAYVYRILWVFFNAA